MVLNWASGTARVYIQCYRCIFSVYVTDAQHHHVTFSRLAQRRAVSELLRYAMKGNLCFSIISFLKEPRKQNCTGIPNSN